MTASCDRIQELILNGLSGATPPAEEREVADTSRQCARCRNFQDEAAQDDEAIDLLLQRRFHARPVLSGASERLPSRTARAKRLDPFRSGGKSCAAGSSGFPPPPPSSPPASSWSCSAAGNGLGGDHGGLAEGAASSHRAGLDYVRTERLRRTNRGMKSRTTCAKIIVRASSLTTASTEPIWIGRRKLVQLSDSHLPYYPIEQHGEFQSVDILQIETDSDPTAASKARRRFLQRRARTVSGLCVENNIEEWMQLKGKLG